METGETVAGPMSGHRGGVVNAAFSPNGKWLVTVDQDGAARLWDAETGSARGSSQGSSRYILDSLSNVLAFRPEGNAFVATDIEGIVREWPVFESVPAELCGKLSENMSRKAWREWVSVDIEYRQPCADLPIAPEGP
ncbi:WD40 repeat domain-containing protein [Nocardia sp. CC227C]|uniref:WD40 repeat domain-containing protein n=1 Tax=Nocardia sp. CC227C TaxID=3044562 RepID=UPI00278C103D|nr:hypothetical protein [Nocardia sp. CC227C]